MSVGTLIGLHEFVAYEGDMEYEEHGETGLLIPKNPVVWRSPKYKNLIVDVGKQSYLDRLSGLSSVAVFSSLGVGTDNTAAAAGNTRLNAPGSGSAQLQGCDGGFPSRSGFVLTFKATFGTAVANFIWAEAGIFNGTVNGTSLMFNRVIIGPFTKTSAVSIAYTTTITQS